MTGGVRHDYRAGAAVCKACAFKAQCCPETVRGRAISHLVEDPQVRQFRLRGLITAGWELLWACLTYNIQPWLRLGWGPSVVASQT